MRRWGQVGSAEVVPALSHGWWKGWRGVKPPANESRGPWLRIHRPMLLQAWDGGDIERVRLVAETVAVPVAVDAVDVVGLVEWMGAPGDVPVFPAFKNHDRHVDAPLPGSLDARTVNVMDLLKLQPEYMHPHGSTEREFDSLFTTDKPITFNSHGYPCRVSTS